MSYVYIFLSLIFGYLIGSLPTALIIGKLRKGIDIREYGSKNLGATNAGRILGKKYFYIVIFIDAIKCILGMLFSYLIYLFCFKNYNIDNEIYTIAVSLAGTLAMIGHCYPLFANFKGGKGVATALGYLLFTTPICGLTILITFIIVVVKSKYISLGSILCSITAIIYTWTIYIIFKDNYLLMGFGLTNTLGFAIITTIFGLMVIIKHKENIKRLINHNENKINFLK